MAQKTIKLTEPVYDLLDEKNKEDETFSETVERLVHGYEPYPFDEFYTVAHDQMETNAERMARVEEAMEQLPDRLVDRLTTELR